MSNNHRSLTASFSYSKSGSSRSSSVSCTKYFSSSLIFYDNIRSKNGYLLTVTNSLSLLVVVMDTHSDHLYCIIKKYWDSSFVSLTSLYNKEVYLLIFLVTGMFNL